MNRAEGFPVDRRTVVTGLCASGFVGLGFAPSRGAASDAAASVAAQGRALASGEIGQWAAQVGTEFTSGAFRLRLAGVRPLPSAGARPPSVARQRAFLAVFDVTAGGPMPGDLTYRMSARRDGPLDIFISSAATSEFPNRMAAVFN